MKYIAMNIETSSAGIEALITSLMEVGITDVVVEDPRDFEELMDKKFEGSLPAFIAAFSRSKKLSEEELQQLQRLIDEYKE